MESNGMILSNKIRSSVKNTLTVGGAGSGKTNSVVIPNLLQMMGSYVVHDVCGIMYQELAPVFLENGYEVHALNLHDTEKSDGYNPIEYVRNMEDALMIADYLVTQNVDTDVFFQETEKRFIAVCILWAACQESGNNHFSYIVRMLQSGMDRKEDSLSESLIRAFAKVSDVSIAGELCTITKQFSEKVLAILVPFVRCKLEEIAGLFQTDAIKLQSLVDSFQNFVYMGSYDRETVEYMKQLLQPLGAFDELFVKETGKEKPKTKKEKQMFEYLVEKSLYGFKEDAIVITERKTFANDKKYKVKW